MAKQTVNLGVAPDGVGGDSVRGGFTKINANMDELYTLPSQAEAEGGSVSVVRGWSALRVRQAILGWWDSVTSSLGRNLIAASNEQAARNVLQLGTAATKDVATNAQALAGTADVLPDAAGVHAAFKQFGYGGQNPNNLALNCNDLPAGSRSSWTDSITESTAVSLNLPALGGSSSASRSWHVECFGAGSSRLVQEATEVYGVGTTRGRTFTRVKHDTVWYPWVEVMRAGAYGLGEQSLAGQPATQLSWSAFFNMNMITVNSAGPFMSYLGIAQNTARILNNDGNNVILNAELYHTVNTTKNPDGTLKASSPVINLYTDHHDLHNENQFGATPVVTRKSKGVYEITGTLGLRSEGWYLDTPSDRNGNKYFNIEWTQNIAPDAVDGIVDEYRDDIVVTIETFERVWNKETGIFDNGAPIDINELQDRFVQLRFNEIKVEHEELGDENK